MKIYRHTTHNAIIAVTDDTCVYVIPDKPLDPKAQLEFAILHMKASSGRCFRLDQQLTDEAALMVGSPKEEKPEKNLSQDPLEKDNSHNSQAIL